MNGIYHAFVNIQDDEKKKDDIKREFNPQVNVGIDFGTDGTGIAYTFVKYGINQDPIIYDKWKVYTKNGSYNANKIRTTILLNKDFKFMAYGSNALRSYVNLDLYRINILTFKCRYASIANKDEVLLFDHFKMNLYRMLCRGNI